MQFTAFIFATLSELRGGALMYANLRPPGDDYTVSGFHASEESRNRRPGLALNFLIAANLFILPPRCAEILLLAGKRCNSCEMHCIYTPERQKARSYCCNVNKYIVNPWNFRLNISLFREMNFVSDLFLYVFYQPVYFRSYSFSFYDTNLSWSRREFLLTSTVTVNDSNRGNYTF